MHVVDAIPKDIHVLMDFSFSDLKHIALILDNMTFDYDGDSQAHIEAANFLKETFYPVITDTVRGLQDGDPSNLK